MPFSLCPQVSRFPCATHPRPNWTPMLKEQPTAHFQSRSSPPISGSHSTNKSAGPSMAWTLADRAWARTRTPTPVPTKACWQSSRLPPGPKACKERRWKTNQTIPYPNGGVAPYAPPSGNRHRPYGVVSYHMSRPSNVQSSPSFLSASCADSSFALAYLEPFCPLKARMLAGWIIGHIIRTCMDRETARLMFPTDPTLPV